jgi:hypothetical protein
MATDAEKLAQERADALEELIRDVRAYSRRAKTANTRIAYSELENELLALQLRWREQGLINGQEELPLAADRS